MAALNYDAPPTIENFMNSAAFARFVLGPVGSGKTTGCVIELLKRACLQGTAADGLRYSRFAVVRQTLKQLKDTVLKDCNNWLAGLGVWKVSENTYHLNFHDVRSEWIFIPLEDAEDQARLLSMQLTGSWLSECIEMDLSVVAPITGRLGRYPSGAQGTPSWMGLIADTNFPTEMTPWQQAFENPPADWQIFKQPSGLLAPVFDANGRQTGGAENLNWLHQNDQTIKLPLNHPARLAQGRRYYERFVEMYGDNSDWVRRYVKAEYGNDPSGQAVFRESFVPHFHTTDKTELIPGYPLIVAQDFGRNPWSLICQVDHMGRLIVHEEVPATNIGLEKHVTERLKPLLMSPKYLGFRVCVVGDPAGLAKGSIGEESCFDALKRMGLPNFPAPTNDIDPRLRAVEALLARQTNGAATLLINKVGAPFLVRAMSGGYRFKKTRGGALRSVPDKDDAEGFSHVSDCLQYASLVVHGGLVAEISRRLLNRPRRQPRRVSPKGWT